MKTKTAVEFLIELFVLKKGLISLEDLELAKEIEDSQRKITEETSDGYHTFKELYEFRKAYNVALFNEWGKQMVSKPIIVKKDGGGFDQKGEIISIKNDVHKSWCHNDGEKCFGGGWFIVVAMTSRGQISNHYKEEDWNLFQIPEEPKAKYPFDGHTGEDVIFRLLNLDVIKPS